MWLVRACALSASVLTLAACDTAIHVTNPDQQQSFVTDAAQQTFKRFGYLNVTLGRIERDSDLDWTVTGVDGAGTPVCATLHFDSNTYEKWSAVEC